jgi:zinc/manganese transport system ATP-binding protein/zinc transport system ATP-binding protein
VEPIVELRDVSFGYVATPVVRDVSLHLHPGQFAALVGPSGAGKTTLLKLVLGTLQPTSGEVLVAGRPLRGGTAPQVGYVPQLETVDWNFPVTVSEVVLMGRIRRAGPLPWASRAARREVADVLEQLGIADLAQQHIRNLSGGQQQRVFLARALIARPAILVLDEPTTGVDLRTAEQVLHLLGDLNRQGTTILMTTHDLNAAAAHVPWVVCLNGSVVAQGPPELVFTEPTLNATYDGDMMVLRQDGMIFVQQRPHGHSYRDLVPEPVAGHLAGE